MTLNDGNLPPPDPMPSKQQVGIFAYVFSLLSFMPILGALFGFGFVCYGLATRKAGGKMLAVIGLLGILFTGAIYYFFIYELFHKGFFAKGMREVAVTQLNTTVVNLEFYKSQNGHYPDSLTTLEKALPDQGSNVKTLDASTGLTNMRKDPTQYYYELVDADHYYLLGAGPDQKPFTCDDVVPKIDPKIKTGLLIKDVNCSPAPAAPPQ